MVRFDRFRIAGIVATEYKPDQIREKYNSFDPHHATMGTVEYWARKGKWNPSAGLLERLEKLAVDPGQAEQLITEVAAAGLSPLDFEKALVNLCRITGFGKSVLKAAL